MDESISKIIKSRTSQQEIELSYCKIERKMIEILEMLLENSSINKENLLLLYDSNIWEIIERYSAEINKTSFSEVTDIVGHDKEVEESQASKVDNQSSKQTNELLVVQNNKKVNMNKLGTYVERK